MTQREVVETMIRKHEISNFMYTDEDEDTTRYIIQNVDDRRTCRRSQYNKNENSEAPIYTKDSSSPIDLQKCIILGAKRNSIEHNMGSIELEDVNSDRQEEIKQNLITQEVIDKLTSDITKNLEYLENLENHDKSKQKPNSHEEKKLFLYLNMLEQLSQTYPKLKNLLMIMKDGFQIAIRNIVANEINEKKIQNTDKIQQQKENLSKMQKQINDRRLIIEEQEDIIESKDNSIQQMKHKLNTLTDENKNLQSMLEKHRVNGIQLQDENEKLKNEVNQIKKIQEDIIDHCDGLESTDQDMAQALKDIRDQEIINQFHKFEKYSKHVPKLNLEKVHEIIRQK